MSQGKRRCTNGSVKERDYVQWVSQGERTHTNESVREREYRMTQVRVSSEGEWRRMIESGHGERRRMNESVREREDVWIGK